MLIDTHAHLDFEDFDDDRNQVINKAINEEVKYIVNIGTDFASSRRSLELTREHENIYTCVGVHPHQAKVVDNQGIKVLKDLSKADKVVGIGETGLDFYYDNSPRDKQKEIFRKLINLAKQINLPVVIHSRDAHNKTIEILEQNNVNKGVFHCFTGDQKMAEKILELGLLIAVGGIVTFNNAQKLQKTIQEIPLNKLLIETDSPYLTPAPNRGQRNEPAYVKYVVQKIADLKDISVKKVAQKTSENALNLFGLE